YKVEYHYSGDVILQKDYYHFNIELNQWESTGNESYTYNSNGYLIEVLQDNGNKTTFEYEEGHGNAKLFLHSPGSFINGEPTLKSASLYGIGNDISYYQ